MLNTWFVVQWIDFQLVLLTVFHSYIMFLETLVLLARNQGVWDVQIPRIHRPEGYHRVPGCCQHYDWLMGAT